MLKLTFLLSVRLFIFAPLRCTEADFYFIVDSLLAAFFAAFLRAAFFAAFFDGEALYSRIFSSINSLYVLLISDSIFFFSASNFSIFFNPALICFLDITYLIKGCNSNYKNT